MVYCPRASTQHRHPHITPATNNFFQRGYKIKERLPRTRDVKLIYKKDSRKLYFHITVPIKISKPSVNSIVGVDIGINKLLIA